MQLLSRLALAMEDHLVTGENVDEIVAGSVDSDKYSNAQTKSKGNEVLRFAVLWDCPSLF